MKDNFRIADLIAKNIRKETSSAEDSELQAWLDESRENEELFTKLSSDQHLLDNYGIYKLFDQDKSWASLETELFPTKVVKFDTRTMLRYAASIVLPLLLISGLIYYLNFLEKDSLAGIDEIIAPGTQKATLVLSDGEKVDLQSESAPTNLKQGVAVVKNQNQVLTYTADVEEESIVEQLTEIYNELVTPRGGNYNLTLADGTKVWLNAASTLKFPVAFTDSIRHVYLTGEAFFDVAHNGKPFIVSSGEADIRVLGTSFNVSAYPDDPSLVATLVDGSIAFQTPTSGEILTPNDQAVLTLVNNETTIKPVNTAVYTSWVNGKIEFSYDNMEAVMRKLARWYDFEYQFENSDARDYHFSASLENTGNISSILEMIKLTTDVELKLENNTIVIL